MAERLIPLALLFLAACSADQHGDLEGAATSQGDRRALSAEFLLSADPLDSPVSTTEFQPGPGNGSRHRFQGRLTLVSEPGAGRLSGLIDWFGYLDDPGLEIADLPPFSFDFVQDGNDLLPVLRGPQPGAHPHWEFILEPGRVWDEPGDAGWSRAALPFSLQERNANCTHNGLLSFLFNSDGGVSRIAYQVGSETCQYLQADLWGVVTATYAPGPLENAEVVVDAFRREVAARLPVKPIEALTRDYPGTDLGNFDWFPAEEVSTFGFAIDGVHYSGGCNTRYGPYPFCEVLDLPSYSLAKSIFAGTTAMMLAQEFPGSGELQVTDHVPECARDVRWQNVTLQHLIDMTTGNYTSLEPDVDEFASYETDFMEGDTHAQKITTACTLFPRKAQPGSSFAYHTSDTYIAGTLMNAFLRRQHGPAADIHRDLLVQRLMKPLGLSPVTWSTRRTYDAVAQPFAGWGLTLHPDDVARLGLLLAQGEGVVDGRQLIDRDQLQAALQRVPDLPAIAAGDPSLRYKNGFWAYRTDLHGECATPLWIPFMSGYGGISVAILPNQSLFYVFSDKGRFEWLRAAIESNRIRGYCEV